MSFGGTTTRIPWKHLLSTDMYAFNDLTELWGTELSWTVRLDRLCEAAVLELRKVEPNLRRKRSQPRRVLARLATALWAWFRLLPP